jgi:hypothetical protein
MPFHTSCETLHHRFTEMNPPKFQPSRQCSRAGRPTVKWLADMLGFSEVRMRELLRTKTPPGFVRSKGGRWSVKGPITADRLDRLRRFYAVPEAPEMTLEKLQAFDAIYEEFVSWSKSMASAEKLAETHPLIGPVYRKFKALEKELSVTPAEIVAAREVIVSAKSWTPLDDDFWKSPHALVYDFKHKARKGADVSSDARRFPKKFILLAALQRMAARNESRPTWLQLARQLRIHRSTLFRWARREGVQLSGIADEYFPKRNLFDSISPEQERDLRFQKFGRQRFEQE